MTQTVNTKIYNKKIGQKTQKALDLLRVPGTDLYRAAHPGYPGNFSRDSLTYGMLAGDKHALYAQIEYSAKYQGTKKNPVTGEEPGKIHHELPEVIINNKSSAYNACDTTALFLLAIASLYESGDEEILKKYSKNIQAGILYIKSHIRGGLFYENPAYCGSETFALNVTYWKDSELNYHNPIPHYPIVFSLAHFQNAAAIAAIGRAIGRSDLSDFSIRMVDSGLNILWKQDHFITALDGDCNEIDSINSDSLHALLYIDPDYIPDGYAEKIQQYMSKLDTKAGYLSGIAWKNGIDDYHTRYIWVHEQALLHAASKKHNLEKCAEVAVRTTDFINSFPELIDPKSGYIPAGNQPQLWAIGASLYFENPIQSLL